MSFIRPEAATFLRQWGLPAILAVVGMALIWKGWILTAQGAWVGVVLMVLGAFCGLTLVGVVERALAGWRGRHGGPGIVTVEEGRISYFGPQGGGILALDALTLVEIVTTDNGPVGEDLCWRLADSLGQQVVIPGGAKGTQDMLDTLGTLPGFDHLAVVRAMGSTSQARFAIWSDMRTDLPGQS